MEFGGEGCSGHARFLSQKLQVPSKRRTLVHCYKRAGNAGIGQAIKQARALDDRVCNQVPKQPDKEDVACTVEQCRLSATRCIQFGFDHRHGQTQCRLLMRQGYRSRLVELLQKEGGDPMLRTLALTPCKQHSDEA